MRNTGRLIPQNSNGGIIFSILLSLVQLSFCLLVGNPNLHRCGPLHSLLFELRAAAHDDCDITYQTSSETSRRSFLGAVATGSTPLFRSRIAAARGLVRFPCKDGLLNTYTFMRAGTSLLELDDVWSTNPLFLTNREAALSEVGEGEVRRACNLLKASGITPTVVRYSLAASCIDTANIVGEELKIGRDRVLPEFNYLDPRAIGGWDFSQKNRTEAAVWALDVDEAGPSGKGGRPPPNEDGTPSETLSDQVVRLTNLMSVLETLYSGDDILLIFPDGTGPALLSCLIAGLPLNRVHELNFQSGETRQIDYNSVNTMASQKITPYYQDTIERGRQELLNLRKNPDAIRNVKDLQFEQELEEQRSLEEAQRKEQQEQAEQNELDRRRKLEEERRLKSEQQKERVKRRQQLDMERQNKQTLNATDPVTSNIGIWGVTAAGLSLLALGRDESVDKSTTESNLNATEKSIELVDSANHTSAGADWLGEKNNTYKTTHATMEDDTDQLDTDNDDTNSIQIEEHVTTKDNETQVKINNSSITPTNVINGDYIDSDYDDSWLASINDIMKEEFDNEET